MTDQMSLLTSVLPPAPKPDLPAPPPRPVVKAGKRSTKPKRQKLDAVAREMLLREAREIIVAANEAVLALQRRRLVGLVAMFEDIVVELHRNQHGSEQAFEKVLGQLAAPDGTVPMHGQPGRFFITVKGALCGVMYGGMRRYGSLMIEAVRFDKKWLMPDGVLSLYNGTRLLDMEHRREGEGVDQWVKRLILADLKADDEKAVRLYELRHREERWKDGKTERIDVKRSGPVRDWLDEWKPGGFLYERRLAEEGVATVPLPRDQVGMQVVAA